MELFGQMARVPVTARQKCDEAAYFYNRMLASRLNVIVFPYYVSAFLSALRSVTMYMQKQYAHNERFANWYPAKQTEMGQDEVLRMLNKARVAVVHREPLDPFFRKGFKMPARYGEYIETTHFELVDDQEPDGTIKMSIKVGVDGEPEPVEPWITWHFAEDDPEDVMNHCYAGLKKLDAMLRELRALRVGMGMPPDEELAAADEDDGHE